MDKHKPEHAMVPGRFAKDPEAARLMREHHVGSLVIVEELSEDQRVVAGMLADRDPVAQEMQAVASAVGASQKHERTLLP